MQQVHGAQNAIHLNGSRVGGDQIGSLKPKEGGAPRKMLTGDQSSQGYSRQCPSSMSAMSAARKDLQTREAINRDHKIKRDDQEIEERVEFNGESEISESKSKQSLLSFLKNDYGGSGSQQSGSQSDLNLIDGVTNGEITEQDFDMGLEGSQSQLSFMLDKIDINNPDQK